MHVLSLALKAAERSEGPSGGGVLLWGGSSQTAFACDRYFGSRLGQKAQDRVVVGYAPPKPKQNGAVKSVERKMG